MIGCTAEVNNDAQDDQASDGDDLGKSLSVYVHCGAADEANLDRRKHEFRLRCIVSMSVFIATTQAIYLAVSAGTEEVNADDHDKANGDPSCVQVGVLIPVVDEYSRSGELGRQLRGTSGSSAFLLSVIHIARTTMTQLYPEQLLI